MLKKKRSKRLLKAGVATTCFLSLSMTTFATPQAYGMKPKETVDIVKSSLNIYPVPQKIEHKSAGFTLKNEVNIVIHGEQEEATMARLEKTLKEHNISYVINDVVVNDKANIVITSNKDHCDDCLDGVTTDLETLNKREGYLLNISDDINENGIITITASDKDGAYYGVITLDQILDQAKDNKIAEVLVADYPEIKNRGFIEGFYGVPWSHEDRMSLMADTSEYKMNTYIYAPKDDPYHRAQWKELYPEDKAQEIAELAKAGKDNNLNFCWTIHPGATLKFTEEDYQAIIRKFEQLYDLGVRQFGVLFDDTDDWTNGGKQADWINRINEEFVKAKGDVENMIVISARYNSAWGPSMNNYFKPFMQKLQNTDIEVMWTGHATMSNVSKSVFEWPKTQTGVNKDVAVWWNYPVNDYCDGKLLMAPMHNLNPDLDNVTGFYSNPMNQAEASKVALYSIADYTWNTDSFDYMQSWETAVEKLVPEASSEFKRFAANISYLSDDGGASGPFIFDESVYLADKIEAFNLAIQNKESLIESATALLEEFETIKSDVASIRTKVDNKNLQKEIEPFLGSYEALSHAGIGAMKAVIAAEKGDIKEWMLQTKEAKNKLASMQNFTVDRIEAEGPRTYVAEVGTKRLKPLVASTITKGEEIMSSALSGDNSAKAISNIKDIPEIEVTLNEGRFAINNIEDIKFNKDQYVGLALPKAMMASKIELEASSYENLEVQASINGVEWTSVNGEVADGVFTANINEGVTFVRVVNKGAGATLDINKLEVTPIYKAKLSISQNIGTYQNYTIENAIDGNMETKYWSDKPSAPGNYIQLDLGAVIPVYDITSYFGSTDKMRNSEYEISVDGANWTSLGELNYTAQGAQSVATVNANGQMAKYIRISAKGSNSGYWVQLYEMEVNKSVPGGGSDYVELVTGTPEGNFENLYDGDLSTAYEAAAVNEGDSLVYKMTRVTDVKELVFLQDENNICGAKVSVKDKSGNWTEVGTLSEEFNAIPVNKTILEVKLEFDATKAAPKIYEIITREGEIEVPPTTGETPNKPTEFKATDINKNSVSMTWEAPTNVEIKEYIIYRDGKEIGRTSDTSFVAEGLRANSIYGFKIVAVSNEDKESKPISINVRTRK